MRKVNWWLAMTIGAWGFALVPKAHADVVAPSAYAGAEAPADFNGPLGSFSGALTAQFDYAASQLTGLSTGTTITSIGFRLDSSASTVNSALNFSQYDVYLGSSQNPIGALSSTYANNEGADTVLARTGTLTIAAGALVGGGSPNPFYVIQFTTPYTYQGGDLLLTIDNAQNPAQAVDLDAVQVGGVTDSVVSFDPNATSGTAEYFDVPVVSFGTSAGGVTPVLPLPEPGSLALMATGLAALGAGLLRRRSRGATAG